MEVDCLNSSEELKELTFHAVFTSVNDKQNVAMSFVEAHDEEATFSVLSDLSLN